MHGTKCGVQDSAAELKNVPQAHLATRQEQKVLIGVLLVTRHNVKIRHGYYLLLPIIDLPKKGKHRHVCACLFVYILYTGQ